VTPVAQSFVLFKTDLFVYHQPDEDLDRWFVGGDCAGWFYARLLPVHRVQPHQEPVMEDWHGWTFSVAVGYVRPLRTVEVVLRHPLFQAIAGDVRVPRKVSVNVWAFSIENCWLLGIDPGKRLFGRDSSETLLESKQVVCGALENIISAEPRIVKHEWFAENPWDLDIMEF
jgi:hypothetical protein